MIQPPWAVVPRTLLALLLVVQFPPFSAANHVLDDHLPQQGIEQWRDDLRVFAREMPRCHKNAFHAITEQDFSTSVEALDRRIPKLEQPGIVVGFQQLAAAIGDGHTFLETSQLYRTFPLELFWFADELRVIATHPAYERALGTRLVKVGDLDIAEVQRRLQPLVPQAENAWYVLNRSAEVITQAEALVALHVLPSAAEGLFTFADDDGNRFELRIASADPGSQKPRRASMPVPVHWQRPGEGFWFIERPDSTVYVNFRSYQNIEQHAAQLLDFLRARQPQRLIVDMRQNSGGNYTLVRQHLLYKLQTMPNLNRPGGLYILTGRGTFSAAMTNVTDFRRETDAVLVGEPTGARPNGYQERGGFTLPHSGLQVSCSILRYRFQPESDDPPAVMPDRRIDPDWRLYKVGRDPVLEWIEAQPLVAPRSRNND
jgi:hypothetical protein